MNELLKNTVKIVEKFNDEIRDDLSSKGIDNTGEASNSIRIDVNEGMHQVRSFGVGYMYYLDRGRGPGKFPPPDVIEEWTINKPVEISPFLVGRKIAREGTAIFKDKSKGIELDKKRKQVLRILKEKAPKWAKEDVLIQMRGINKI